MPRSVSAGQRSWAIHLMKSGMGQREISEETQLSRPYIRKLAREIGFQFPRNGIEIQGRLCMCTNCGIIFRRNPSKVERAKHLFCDEDCRLAFSRGPNHPSWKTGKTAATFSTWVVNQAAYKDWRQKVLERDGNACIVSGRTENLQAHHIMQKAESFNPEKAFDVENGITLNVDVHQEIHELIREGYDFEEAIMKLKQKYSQLV